MKIERINENSISCTLSSFDLSVRNLNIRELAYGSEKARKLFEEMMNKASTEVGFNADGTPIMIEAIPMGDSIKLIISKVTDPEELDARFSRFTKSGVARRDAENWLSKLASFLLEGAADMAGEAGETSEDSGASADTAVTVPQADKASAPDEAAKAPALPAPKAGKARSKARPAAGSAPEYRAFAFDDLDMVISASRAAGSYEGRSTLYKSPSVPASYVLIVKSAGPQDDSFARCCNSIAEYGRMIRTVQNTLVYYDEHYQVIVAEDAIGKLATV